MSSLSDRIKATKKSFLQLIYESLVEEKRTEGRQVFQQPHVSLSTDPNNSSNGPLFTYRSSGELKKPSSSKTTSKTAMGSLTRRLN